MCKQKKREFLFQVNENFKKVKDAKSFWILIKQFEKSNFINSLSITSDDWLQHFNILLNPTLLAAPIHYAPPLSVVPTLDCEFN